VPISVTRSRRLVALWLTEGTVEKHVRSILSKLNMPETADDHRRVRAVITFLESR
jgi:DNA-binding NarL/FixJ family response regulator